MADSSYDYPDPMASPKEKASKAYILKYGKALYYNFSRTGVRMFYNDRVNYQKLMAYAQGNQPISAYQKRLNPGLEDDPDQEVFMNINWQILNLATKFVNIIVGKLNKIEYDDICTPIDPVSVDAKKLRQHLMESYVELEEWMATLGIGLTKEQLGFDPQIMPKTSDEIEIHMQLNDKDEMAMEAELAIELVKNNNNFHQIRKEYLQNMTIMGIMGIEVKNTREGITKIKHIPPQSLIVGNSKSEDYKNVPAAGYVDPITFAELKVQAGSQFTEEEYKDIYDRHFIKQNIQDFATDPNSVNNANFNFVSNERTGTIMKFYFKTYNDQTYEKKKDARGNRKMYPTTSGKGSSPEYQEKYAGEREIIKDSYEVVYEGTWIVGTDYVYNHGLLIDMAVTKSNMCETRIPLHIYAPNMMNGKVVSLLNEMIPVLDEIQINWLQFQHAIANYIPDGQAINLDAIVEAPLGKAGKRFTPKEVLDMYYKKGILVYKSSKLDGQNGNSKPVEPMVNSNLEKAQTFLNNIFTLVAILRQVSGINEAADASTPAPDALVGTSAMALAGTDNALEYLFHSDRMTHKNLAEFIVLLIQNAIGRREISGFITAMGSTSAKFWKVNKDISLKEFGISTMPRATKEERDEFHRLLGDAYAKGVLPIEDYLDIKEIKNIKLASNYMKVLTKRRKKEAEESQAASNDQQAQNNLALATAAEREKQNTIALENKLKKETEMELKGMDRAIQKDKNDAAILMKTMDVQSKVDGQHIQADAKVMTTHMQGENKKEVEEMKPVKEPATK